MTTAWGTPVAVPAWSEEDLAAIRRLRALGSSVAEQFVGRRAALDLLEVAVIAREHVLLLGPPGTGKTDLITRFAAGFGTAPFVRLITRFTEPAEVFGPVDVKSFREGRYEVRTEGMLPTARIAFLDEIFQSGSPILNTLLTVLNERVFHNGRAVQPVPLITLVGAANSLPQDPALLAFADRFLLRLQVAPVAGDHLEELLGKHLARSGGPAAALPGEAHEWVSTDALERLNRQMSRVGLSRVGPYYTGLVRELLDQGVTLSDRRITHGLRLVAAAALRAERTTAEPRDLWPLRHFWADPAQAAIVREAVQRRVEADGGESGPPDRTAHQIVTDAQVTGRQVGPGAAPAAVENTLRALNRLRLELRRADPGNQRDLAIITTIINNTLALLQQG